MPAVERPSILIVDDDVDICRNLADIFEDLGYWADTAYDGAEALALIERNSYDVAILDMKMPDTDGLTLYRQIKERSAGTVAIIVTAYIGRELAAEAIAAGAWDVLPKPVEFPDYSVSSTASSTARSSWSSTMIEICARTCGTSFTSKTSG